MKALNCYQGSAETFREALCLTVPAVRPKREGAGFLDFEVISKRIFSWNEYLILLLMADAKRDLGRFDDALNICDAVTKSLSQKEADSETRDKLRPAIYHSLAEVYLKKGLYSKAL